MTRQYLDFEIPIKEIDEKIAKQKALPNEENGRKADLAVLETKRNKIIESIFSKLNRWQRVR
ncbi:acetyl-CoA carboxylase carboxyl transferase subunit alpha, partial [Candidatus Neomarinimicrobiota bacterium]